MNIIKKLSVKNVQYGQNIDTIIMRVVVYPKTAIKHIKKY